ncbi:carboxymuconolactone decarboxylase family protein [Neotamlana sedimentorum]|uniref:carboxymuconolactone decarboxylase family protein n=1 Tax=Neotamlana sedimentorum TaxID=1435349 RepID=UPI00069A3859|nr:carboxymuconolactone decarboxylase family protein [Tamlana sedimentorum]
MENVIVLELKVSPRDEVATSNQEIFDNLNKALGFVPNLYATMAYSDHGLRRYLNFQNAKTSFSNKEKEAINLIVSEVNGCVYCLSTHTLIEKMNGFTDTQLLDIKRDTSGNAKLDALVKLAADITKNKGNADDENVHFFLTRATPKKASIR